ncbi:MAG: hypothetical protein F4039_05405 [Gammaproteobacteria bacterium]|nr:hypothetical protein [Gammaproteobacteria bacterium]
MDSFTQYLLELQLGGNFIDVKPNTFKRRATVELNYRLILWEASAAKLCRETSVSETSLKKWRGKTISRVQETDRL